MDDQKKILIVDDVEANRFVLRNIISEMGHLPVLAENGVQSLKIMEKIKPNLILLDVAMPEMDGYELCRILKDDPVTRKIPISFISAFDKPDDIIKGFSIGGEDYITKPFSVRELMARVKANLRKNDDEKGGKEKKEDTKIVVGNLELDLEKVEVKVKGEVKPLTPKEFELVKFLAMQPGVPVTREVLLEKVWNYEYYGDIRTVDVTVCRIREKLGDSTKNSKIIINKRGIGYYLASK